MSFSCGGTDLDVLFDFKGGEMEGSELHNAITRKVLGIWQDVLSNMTCKVDDDFLDAGGDSLAAMLCISRIHEEFGVELELDEFFLEPATVRKLSTLIETSLTDRSLEPSAGQ